MERHVNTYQGLNMDTAYDSIAPNLYIDAVDIRITTTNGESMGGWTNIQGNKVAFTIPDNSINAFPAGEPFGSWTAEKPEIIGYTTVRNRIIIFVADDSNTQGWIYEVQYDPATREILTGYPKLKYYNANLTFKKEWPIEALGRYESDCVIRVYWTDYNNYFRSLNLEDNNLTTLPIGQLDIFPSLEYKQPLLKIITGGGSLQSGEYQIAYRLITLDGKQTLISPPSNLIHVVLNADYGQSAQYNGDLSPVFTGKSLQVEVDTSTYGAFNKIEFIVAYYATGTAIPEIKSIESISINNNSTITFVYTGDEGSAFPIEVYDFIIKNNPFKTPKTITQKDNSLVIANIKGSSISIQDLLPTGETFDGKTRRYRNIGGIITPPNPIDPSPLDPTGNNLKNAFNELYNKDAHWDTTWHTDQQYRYQLDGATLGGQGPNISYKFHLEPFTLDGEKAVGQAGFANVGDTPDFVYTHNLNDGYGTYANTTWPNYASPFLSGLLRGYKRGETYRFGIIFYTKKGDATYVEYIGDIKFPDISEEDSTVNSSGTKYWPISQSTIANDRVTIGYAMGIEFTVDFSSCPSIFNLIDSYQIVRVKREDSDRRRLTQGIMKSFFFNVIESADPDLFNFEATAYGNSRNVLHILPSCKPYSGTGVILPHSFALIGDSQSPLNNLPASSPNNDYLIKSQFLGFYSPELSFNFDNYRNLAASQSENPCLLMTGAYDEATRADYGAAFGAPINGTGVSDNYAIEDGYTDIYINSIPHYIDLTSESLARFAIDGRKKYSATIPVNYNSIENIKKLKETTIFSMKDDVGLQDCVTPLWSTSQSGSYHVRNYWALDECFAASDNLNQPNSGGSSDFISEVSKGGTSLLTLTDRFYSDPLTSQPVTPAATDFFRIKNNTTLPGGIEVLYTTTTNPNGTTNEYYPILDLVLPKQEVYGGFNKNALESNIFIIASPVINLSNNNPKVFGGDIFINFFTCNTSTLALDSIFFKTAGTDNIPQDYARSASRTDVFPVETVMNLELAYGATTRTEVYYTYGALENTILRQEINNTRTTYGKIKEMYGYNAVNSRENTEVVFFVQPEGEKACKINDTRTYLSNVKVNGEELDSWVQFPINNYYDLDDYGPINKILNWKDIVHFIQNKAVGIFAINRAAITTTNDGVPTALGTGQGFGKHQYYSKEHGSIHQWGIQATENGIYYFDAIHRKFFRIQGSGIRTENFPLSEIKGVHSWLQKLPNIIFASKENGGDNPILKKGVTAAYDKINDEVIFTFLGTGDYVALSTETYYPVGTIVYSAVTGLYYLVVNAFTSDIDKQQALFDLLANSVPASESSNFRDDSIVFDELMDQFSSRYSACPKIWINNGDILLSPNPDNSSSIYTHNIGNWGEFYGTVKECSLTMVLNFQADINKILRTLEFNSIVRDNNKTIDRTKTITAFKITTEYQSTNKVLYSADRIKRKFDKWRVKIPRNQLSNSKQDRLRSTHFVLTLYFDNLENKEIICNRLMSYYDFQIF